MGCGVYHCKKRGRLDEESDEKSNAEGKGKRERGEVGRGGSSGEVDGCRSSGIGRDCRDANDEVFGGNRGGEGAALRVGHCVACDNRGGVSGAVELESPC